MFNPFTEKYLTFLGKRYTFDLGKLKDICLISDEQKGMEKEITEAYERDDVDGSMNLSSRILREVKGSGNPQNDMIIYDIVKLFIVRLMENASFEDEFKTDFSTMISLNTLINWGIIKEIND